MSSITHDGESDCTCDDLVKCLPFTKYKKSLDEYTLNLYTLVKTGSKGCLDFMVSLELTLVQMSVRRITSVRNLSGTDLHNVCIQRV